MSNVRIDRRPTLAVTAEAAPAADFLALPETLDADPLAAEAALEAEAIALDALALALTALTSTCRPVKSAQYPPASAAQTVKRQV